MSYTAQFETPLSNILNASALQRCISMREACGHPRPDGDGFLFDAVVRGRATIADYLGRSDSKLPVIDQTYISGADLATMVSKLLSWGIGYPFNNLDVPLAPFLYVLNASAQALPGEPFTRGSDLGRVLVTAQDLQYSHDSRSPVRRDQDGRLVHAVHAKRVRGSDVRYTVNLEMVGPFLSFRTAPRDASQKSLLFCLADELNKESRSNASLGTRIEVFPGSVSLEVLHCFNLLIPLVYSQVVYCNSNIAWN